MSAFSLHEIPRELLSFSLCKMLVISKLSNENTIYYSHGKLLAVNYCYITTFQ